MHKEIPSGVVAGRALRVGARAERVPQPLVAVGRVAGAGLLAAMAWIHWHLYTIGFSSIANIGPAFYANAVLGALAALAVLVAPRKLLAYVAVAAALLDAGTLGALILSLTVGLLGFHESLDAPLIPATFIVESVGTLVLIGLSIAAGLPIARWRDRIAARRHPQA